MDFTQIKVFQDAQSGMSHFCHFASNILVNLCEATVFFHLKHAHVQDGPSMTKSDHKELHYQKNYQEIETPSKISKQAMSCANYRFRRGWFSLSCDLQERMQDGFSFFEAAEIDKMSFYVTPSFWRKFT